MRWAATKAALTGLLAALSLGAAACAGSERTEADVTPDAVAEVVDDLGEDGVADTEDAAGDVAGDAAGDADGGPDVVAGPRPFHIADAGDEAWVKRATLALLGRRNHGMREVRALVDLVKATDRATVARVLMAQPEFESRWIEWFVDDLRVNRVAHKEHRQCFGVEGLSTDEELSALAAHLRDTAPEAAAFPSTFTMRDLLRAGLRSGDISVALRGFLFAMQSRPLLYCANLPVEEMERSRRRELAGRFSSLYLQRTASCLPCHNSEFSVTDDVDPELDRFWPVPGRFEQAIFGESGGRSEEDLAGFFRFRGVSSVTALASPEEQAIWPDAHAEAIRPWGISDKCSELFREEDLEEDPYDRPAWLVEAPDGPASIWDVERRLRRGIEGLRSVGTLAFDPELPWPGDWSLAYQTAQRLAQSVWTEVHGSPLTVSHHFPRNEHQRDTLWELTNALVESDWSFGALLVEVLTHPLFNPVAPAASTHDEPWDPYVLPPVFNPWTRAEEDPDERNNSVGDMVNRPSGFVMISMAADALGWPTPDGFPLDYDTGAYLYAAGVYLSDTEPGFRGVGFQDRLTWEAVAGQCRPLPTYVPPGCKDASCYIWSPDWIDALTSEVDAQVSAGGLQPTVRDVVQALKDRLINEPDLAEGEAELLAGLYGVDDLDTPLSEAEGWRPKLRVHCAVLLNAPQFMLTGLAGAPQQGEPRLVVGEDAYADHCARMAPTLAELTGKALTCGEDSLTVAP